MGSFTALQTAQVVLDDDHFEFDPATGTAWTKAGVDALEAGVEVMA